MRSLDTGNDLLGGRLRVRSRARLGEVDLDEFKAGDRRLLIVVDGEVVSGDPIVHTILRMALPGRAEFGLVDPHQPHELVSDLASAADTAACWISGGHEVEVVVVEPVPLNLTAACMLVATGVAPPTATAEAFAAAGQVPTDSDEIATQVFATHLLSYRCWHEARRLARQEARQ